jgi:UrcA family protein
MQRSHHLARVVGMLLALGATSAGGVAAEPVAENARSVAVPYGDLDLGNRLAAQRLYARIAAAAERACGDYDQRDLRARADWLACYEAALEDAISRVPNAALAETYRWGRQRRG